MKAVALFLALTLGAQAATPIEFRTGRPGFVSLNIYRADGTVVRELLTGSAYPAGDHAVTWDGLAGGKPLPPGDYHWRALYRDRIEMKVRGWIGDFGGDKGEPAAVAADDSQIYLGWSKATADADAVVACDPAGKVHWTHRRGAVSGCRGLGVDAGMVYVLGGEGAEVEGRAIYRLNARDGGIVPWPNGRTDLEISSLWPAKANYKPDRADYFAVSNGRMYLSFSGGQFIAVLDAKTGAYLQTIVGAPPGPVDAVPTKTASPEHPDQSMDADFVTTSLHDGIIGKMLLAHDPIWVLASALTPLDEGQRIAALRMMGDGAPHHKDEIFVGLAPPWNQVQARSALDSDTVIYVAGRVGGTQTGARDRNRMGVIRGIALDAKGQLWVAEGDANPRRVSVWTTDAAKGRLVREYFSPPDATSPVAIDPLDPKLLIAGGCEWRIDPETGRAGCLGVITQDALRSVRFAMEKGKVLLVLTPANGPDLVLERAGDGDYRPHDGPAPAPDVQKFQIVTGTDGAWRLDTADGYDLGIVFEPAATASGTPIAAVLDSNLPNHLAAGQPALTQMADGRIFLTARGSRLWDLELTGLGSVTPLADGKVSLP